MLSLGGLRRKGCISQVKGVEEDQALEGEVSIEGLKRGTYKSGGTSYP